MSHPRETLSSSFCKALTALLLQTLQGVRYMLSGSWPREDFKMWLVKKFGHPLNVTSDTELCSHCWTASRLTFASSECWPSKYTLPHAYLVCKLAAEVVMKWNHGDIVPWQASPFFQTRTLSRTCSFAQRIGKKGVEKERKSLNNWIAIKWFFFFFPGSWWYFTE